MNQMLRKALLTTIAILCGVIIAIVAGLLTYVGGGQITDAICDGGIGFAGTTTFVLVMMASLGALEPS